MDFLRRPRHVSMAGASHMVLLVLILLLGTPSYAWAYIDPGVGSYVFQLTIAALLAGIYTIRRYFHSVLAFLRPRIRRERSDRDDATHV